MKENSILCNIENRNNQLMANKAATNFGAPQLLNCLNNGATINRHTYTHREAAAFAFCRFVIFNSSSAFIMKHRRNCAEKPWFHLFVWRLHCRCEMPHDSISSCWVLVSVLVLCVYFLLVFHSYSRYFRAYEFSFITNTHVETVSTWICLGWSALHKQST